MTQAFPLEPSDEELRRLLDDAVRRVVAHVGSLSAQPADGTDGAGALARALIERSPPRTAPPRDRSSTCCSRGRSPRA